jgi:transglutaminase/protease-like cytokinesis protein 3
MKRQKAVHDYLVLNTEYDLTLSDLAADVEGVLLYGKGICSGYAHTYKLLMQLIGVDCIVVGGTGTNQSGGTESHAWNMVKLDGNWYQVDVTWDDPVFSGARSRTISGMTIFWSATIR